MRTSSFPDFQIQERAPDGRLVRAAERAEYFPIVYSDPSTVARSVAGYDLASESLRRRAVSRAQATREPAATPPITLVSSGQPNGGFLGFIAVKPLDAATNAATPGTAPPQVAGIILVAFEIDKMIKNVLTKKLPLVGLDMYVLDPAGPIGNRLVYWHSSSGKPPPPEASLLAGRHQQGKLQLVDQEWSVTFVPSDGFDANVADWAGFAVLVSGLVLTASIVFYLWISLRRTLQLENLTRSLGETTQELRRNSAKLDHMARHDALTGLANRVMFCEGVADAPHRTGWEQTIAILYLDLDRFKAVNDTLGHPIGDQLLCEVAKRLQAGVREADTIARLGGDEFAIIQVRGEQPQAAEALARRLIDTVSQPYEIEGHKLVIGVSVGITLSARDDADVASLLRQADMALYAAKREGRGTWRYFESTMEHEAQARRSLEADLRQALEQNNFELYYQPQVAIADGRVRGFEALLRWRHPARGLVMPGDFIQCAEETGLIVPIGAWVLRTALLQAAQWPAGLRVAVNLSAFQIARDDLVGTIEAALLESGQAGQRLELEIIESALQQNMARTHEALRQLRARGVRITLDNFGAGSASLSHLRSFPFDGLKIDQSFVAAMTESRQGSDIVRGILRLAASLGIATTAEGVETQAQLGQLAADGCRNAQGMLFSPAVEREAVPGLLSRRFSMLRNARDSVAPGVMGSV